MPLLSHYSNVSLICISTLLYDTFVIFWMSLYNCPLVNLSVIYCVIDSRVYLSFLNVNTVSIILSRLLGLMIGILLDMRCYFAQFPLYIKSWYVIVFVLDAIHLLYYYYLLLLIIVMLN